MSVRLFVGNLPYTAQEADIREHFASVGRPSQVLIPIDRETGRVRGFAFVDFDDAAVAEAAIRTLNDQPFHGRPLAISEARPRGERPSPVPSQPGGVSMPNLADTMGRPARESGARSFGPNKPPHRRGAPRRQQSDRAPRGPLRERSGGRMFDMDDDSADVSADVDDAIATLSGEVEPNDNDE